MQMKKMKKDPNILDNSDLDSKYPNSQVDSKPSITDGHNTIQDKVWLIADKFLNVWNDFYDENRSIVWNAVYLVLLLGYLAYLIYACYYDFEEAMIVLIITGIVLCLFIYMVLQDNYGDAVYKGCCLPLTNKVEDKWDYIRWPLYFFLVVAIGIALFFLTKDHPQQLISAAGLLCLVGFTYAFSKYPRQVQWRPVLWGIALQFILGLFILRTKLGFYIFDFLGNLVQVFLDYTDEGSEFLFGENYMDHFFAFKVQWRPVLWGIALQFILGLFILRTKLGFYIFDFLGNLVQVFLDYTDEGSEFLFGENYMDHFFAFKVQWRPVLWGIALQFILGLFILRTKLGFYIFDFLGNLVQVFLDYTDEGSEFLFGENYMDHFFAFKVLPVVIYFSSVIAVLYYLGVMQVVIGKMAWLMQCTMTTSASESLNAAGNIVIGMTEAPLLIRPYLGRMTKSELHAVMTGGFATIAGSVLGAYISFGISATHLLSASVMSAPAALAIAKLFYPETEESFTVTADQMKLPKGQERNVIEAASFGASTAVPLVLNIAANLIAFLALLALVNSILGYGGGLVGYQDLSFELICSYVFMPLAFLIGADWEDCNVVAELIGIKTFINEFVAYEKLSVYIENRENGLSPTISSRSEIIATYALCGFANVGSIGIQLGGLTSMAPERKGDLASVAVRALIAGTVACFMTACIAGVLYIPESSGIPPNVNVTMMSTTL